MTYPMPDLEERLNAHLDLEEPPQETEGWSITTQDEAAWASRKARDAHREVQAIDAWEEREIERVRAAAESERKRPRQTAEFMESALSDYLVRLAREGRAKKSIALPGGTIQLRKRQPNLTYDEGQLLAWLRENGHTEFVKVKESVSKGDLKKALTKDEGRVVMTSTGEVVPGVDLTEQPDSASFKPNLDEADE